MHIWWTIVLESTAVILLCVPCVFRIDGAHRIMVATSEGRLYIGGIDPIDGGDCKILRDYRCVCVCACVRVFDYSPPYTPSLVGDLVDEEDGGAMASVCMTQFFRTVYHAVTAVI